MHSLFKSKLLIRITKDSILLRLFIFLSELVILHYPFLKLPLDFGKYFLERLLHRILFFVVLFLHKCLDVRGIFLFQHPLSDVKVLIFELFDVLSHYPFSVLIAQAFLV